MILICDKKVTEPDIHEAYSICINCNMNGMIVYMASLNHLLVYFTSINHLQALTISYDTNL